MNIQEPTTSEVSDTDTVMVYNEDIDPSPPQDISNVFTATEFLSHSSSDSDKYKRVNHCLNPPYHHWIVDHLVETKLT